MAEAIARFEFINVKITAPVVSYKLCRYLAGAYANPAGAFVATTNEWYLLTESIVGANAYFYADVPKGKYRLQVENPAATWGTVANYENIHISSLDLDNHINNAAGATDMRHNHDAIAIAVADQGRLGLMLDDALDYITGATWDKDSDNSLKGHLDDVTGAHAATAISCTVGASTTVEAALDDHETRLVALETGAAGVPADIADYSGDIGINIVWTAQNVNAIEYFIKYLWKHDYESIPATQANLSHQRRTHSPETYITYDSRRFDMTADINSNLVLYYAIGAQGGADAAISWSAVKTLPVKIPIRKQEFLMELHDISMASYQTSIVDKDSETIDSDEVFPTCSADGAGDPVDNWIPWTYPFGDITITGIAIYSPDYPAALTTVKYKEYTGNTAGNFTVSQLTGRGNKTGLSLALTAGDALKIWSLDPHGMGKPRIQITFTIA